MELWGWGLEPQRQSFLDTPEGDPPPAPGGHSGLQETLIIDQQIRNVNRAIRPENTDIHHPETNYAAGPDVITGAEFNASSPPPPNQTPALCSPLGRLACQSPPATPRPTTPGPKVSAVTAKVLQLLEDPEILELWWWKSQATGPDGRAVRTQL